MAAATQPIRNKQQSSAGKGVERSEIGVHFIISNFKTSGSGKSTYFTQFSIVYFAFDILAGLNFHDKLSKNSAMTFLLVSYDIEILTLPGYLQWQKPF